MSSWEKHYVVGDPNRKKTSGKQRAPKPPKAPRRKRRWKLWSFILLLFFGAGLSLGLMEDREFEGFVEDALSGQSGASIQSAHDPELWRQVLQKRKGFSMFYTDHILCRMECRSIDRWELHEALSRGKALNEKIGDSRDDFPNDIVTKVRGNTRDGRMLDIVLAVDMSARAVKFITVFEPGYQSQQDNCTLNGVDQCKATLPSRR